MLADVVFPAAAGAYVANLFVPFSLVMAMATEYGVYIYFQRGIISLWKLLFIVLGVNAFSWFVGGFLSCLVPNSFVPQIPHLPAISDLSVLVWACFLSTVLEFFPLWIFRKRLGFRKLGLCVTLANIAGYIVIAIIVKLSHF